MKIYITNKTIEKLKSMINTSKPDFITVRKFKKATDPESNIIKGIKLSDKQRQSHKTGNSYRLYISKEKLKEVKKLVDEKPEEYSKEGGFLPLLGLLLAGLGTATGVATGITKTVLDKQANDAKLEEEKRKNNELIKAARGEGMFLEPYKGSGCPKEAIKNFSNKLNTDEIGKKTIRNILKNMSEYIQIKEKKNGLGLYLQPY